MVASCQFFPSSLERVVFEGIDPYANQIMDFMTFFTRNPNIRTVTFTSEILKRYGLSLSSVGIKFDQISIYDFYQKDDRLLFILARLYENGFYKKLHLDNNSFGMDTNDAEGMVLPGLEKLRLENANVTFPPIPELNELFIDVFDEPNDFENVKNIEKFRMNRLHLDKILYLIRGFPKLKIIKIDRCVGYRPLDLIALNKGRQKVSGACKVTIYINEINFLATKWIRTKTDFRFVELKRIQSFDCNKLFF